ncbi:acylase [Spongiivirga sp. MCCC 1A20706]|uniref:acylase n=1 Tax=Spongiivirga sp. MCCC 1A20706 TaxID=3160963 RepID=UPI003977ADE5
MKKSVLFLFSLFFFLCSCQKNEESKTTIKWDSWGVPHIYATSVNELFYAQGWTQMHNHANLIVEMYGSSRGKGAEYFGEQKFQEDMMIHTLGFEELADEWATTRDPKLTAMFDSFVKGMNDYVTKNPSAVKDELKKILPLSTKDLTMHSMYVIFSRFIAGNDLGRVQQWPDMGSNTYAISPQRSASGNAMLVQNPHLPWWREFTWMEFQLNLENKSIYGANLVGLPGIGIGFNESLGWSHTDNTIDNCDTYELKIKDGGYLLDGERKEFISSSKKIKIKQEDGTLVEREIPIRRTEHGPVVNQSEEKVLAIRYVGTKTPNASLQWWNMANSNNLNEFETALKMAQIPFWNVMYADKHGDIFYIFNGLVPKRSAGDWDYWDRIIPEGKSSDIWTETHAYADLPKVKNPETGWLQNANDPPWTSTIPKVLDPNDYPGYMAPISMSFRPQRSARMLLEDESITFEELVDYKLSTRLEFADRILDDLFVAIDASNSEKAKQAKEVLMAWDREADADSKGMLLFYNWARKFNSWRKSNYSTPWDFKNPNTTPDGLADPEKAVDLLETAATEIETKFGKLDVPWGDFYRINSHGKNLPANGIDGSLGVFRVTWPGGGNENNMFAGGGDSWVGVIEFGETPKAKVLLSYGNASQEGSPHRGDQLELYSKKQLRDAWFAKEEVDANTVKKEVLGETGFNQEVDKSKN